MRKSLVVIGYFIALISLVASYDDHSSTERPKKKPQKYRIVKVYGLRIKGRGTPTSTPKPLHVTPAKRWRYRDSEPSSEESRLPREMLQAQPTPSRNSVNLGELDMENFDVGKLLAAAGHDAGGDPLAPTVVRFSVPSSDSQIDPEYLSKLIREQLGHDAQFQVVPSGSDNKNFRQVIGGTSPSASRETESSSEFTQHTQVQQQVRGGFKQSHQGPLTTTRPASNPHDMFQAVLQISGPDRDHGGGKHHEKGQGHRGQDTRVTTTAKYNPGHKQGYSSTEYPKAFDKGPPKLPTKNFPLYPRSPSALNGFKVGGYPQIQTTTTTSTTTANYEGEYSGVGAYSTLNQEMMAPGLAPAATGQYPASGTGERPYAENEALPELSSHKGPKYSTTFVRGFVDPEPSPKPIKKEKAVDSVFQQHREESRWTNFSVPPLSSSYSSQESISKPKVLQYKSLSQQSSAEVIKSNADSRGQSSENLNQGYYDNQGSISPPAEYEPPKQEYSPPSHQYHSTPQSTGYGAPFADPPPLPPKITKTIYINLPPESSSTTTPKPYKHQVVLPQKHYKIVFIKAPTAPPPEEPEIELPPPAPETKTIIYVLHKKPEPSKKIVITAPPSTEPPSPEVFFIQYKDKEKERARIEEARNAGASSTTSSSVPKWEEPTYAGSNKGGSDSKWEKPKTPEWKPEPPKKWEQPRNLEWQAPDRQKWEEPKKQEWNKPGFGGDSKWEAITKSPEWNSGPAVNKWEEPKTDEWRNGPGPNLWEDTSWTKPGSSNGWSPIYSSKESRSPTYSSRETNSEARDFQQDFDDDTQGYPDARYHMSASAPVPMRVSVTKTISSKT